MIATRCILFEGRPAGLNSTLSSGHSSEAGIRLRGVITPRLFYGATAAWLGISLGDALTRTNVVASNERDRAQRGSLAFGLGYALTDRTVLTFDVAGGTSPHLRRAYRGRYRLAAAERG